MYGYDASFFLTEMYLSKQLSWENFTFTLRSIWNLRYVLLDYSFQKHVLIGSLLLYRKKNKPTILVHNMETVFSVRLILHNFFIVLNLATNPCGSGTPYRRNDEAISCDTQSCPRGFRCNRGYGYAVCCRSINHKNF